MAKRKTNSAAAEEPIDLATSSPLDVRVLERIIKLMAANDLSGLEVQDGDRKVSLHRGGGMIPNAAAQFSAGPFSAAHPTAAPMQSAQLHPDVARSASSAAPPADADAGLVPIKSPMVGTYYSASGPDAKPFVSVGSVVDEETDVCVIEAMKVFNNIKAETRGTIAKIVVSNGQTVEFGQTLFLVKP